MPVHLMIQRLVLWTLVFCSAPVSLAQDSSAPDRSDTSKASSGGAFDFFNQMISPQTPAPSTPQSSEQTPDPTAPSAHLLERIPKPAPHPQPLSVPATTPARRATTAIPLPSLPKITLRGLVMSTPDRGTAMLDVDGNSVTISLVPRDQQQRMPIPDVQFAAMRTALDQRATLTQNASGQAEPGKGKTSFEMCLQCSFVADGIVFNLEAFTPEALLLRAVPHDSILLVRKAH